VPSPARVLLASHALLRALPLNGRALGSKKKIALDNGLVHCAADTWAPIPGSGPYRTLHLLPYCTRWPTAPLPAPRLPRIPQFSFTYRATRTAPFCLIFDYALKRYRATAAYLSTLGLIFIPVFAAAPAPGAFLPPPRIPTRCYAPPAFSTYCYNAHRAPLCHYRCRFHYCVSPRFTYLPARISLRILLATFALARFTATAHLTHAASCLPLGATPRLACCARCRRRLPLPGSSCRAGTPACSAGDACLLPAAREFVTPVFAPTYYRIPHATRACLPYTCLHHAAPHAAGTVH